MSGSISEEEFQGFAESLVHMSSQIGDNWEIRTHEQEVYLYKRSVESVFVSRATGSHRTTTAADDEHTDSDRNVLKTTEKPLYTSAATEVSYDSKRYDSERCDEELDDSIIDDIEAVLCEQHESYFREPDNAEIDLSNKSTRVPRTYEYNIVYSHSYGVPVLYFNVYTTEGAVVGLEEVWGAVPPPHSEQVDRDRWTMLTQQEHPLLGRPYFQLHPCHTADLMKQVPPCRHSNYLVTWLSAVGPVIGLRLPLAYARLKS